MQPSVHVQSAPALNLQAASTAEEQSTDRLQAEDQLHLFKQYLWKHPNRTGRITLYTSQKGNVVSFAHVTDGIPVEDCMPHGSWEQAGKLLKVNFNHHAKDREQEYHTFVRHDPSADVWYLTGIFEGWNAKNFAFLQPWNQEHGV